MATLPTVDTARSSSDAAAADAAISTEKSHAAQGWSVSLRQRLRADVELAHTDIPIIACCFVSGLCDSSAYNAWACFVSMQTGNTIFLGLGASQQPLSHPYGWLKSLVAIASFLAGSFGFARVQRYLGPQTRRALSLAFLLQSACIVVAAALVQSGVVPAPRGIATGDGAVHFSELAPLAILALQSGGQMVASRALGFGEVPTTVLTSVYCDLAADPALIAGWSKNVKRNRRVFAVLNLLAGAIVGGWLSRSLAGMSTSLWIAAFVKLVISMSFATWKQRGDI